MPHSTEGASGPAGHRDGEAVFAPVDLPAGATGEWLGTIIEVVPDAMIVVDDGGTILAANAHAHELFGFGPSELIGAPVDSLVPTHARSRHGMLRAKFREHPVRRPLGAMALVGRRKDGSEFPADISLSPVRSGQDVHIICAVRDMTAREAAERDRRRLLEEQSAREQAEAAVRERDEFLSIANHELRTPVTALKAASQLALRRLRAGQLDDDAELEHFFTLMDDQTSKAARLINDLLDGSRLVERRLKLDRRPADLRAIVRSALEATQLLNAGSQFVLSEPDTPVVAEVDAVRIEQVVVNLLDNAVKFSPRGATIEVDVADDGVEARVAVRDHGIGVLPEYRDRIFDRFYQAPTPNHAAGMGLGLFISRELVDLHGGRLDADFPGDGGTRVIVHLPLLSAASPVS